MFFLVFLIPNENFYKILYLIISISTIIYYGVINKLYMVHNKYKIIFNIVTIFLLGMISILIKFKLILVLIPLLIIVLKFDEKSIVTINKIDNNENKKDIDDLVYVSKEEKKKENNLEHSYNLIKLSKYDVEQIHKYKKNKFNIEEEKFLVEIQLEIDCILEEIKFLENTKSRNNESLNNVRDLEERIRRVRKSLEYFKIKINEDKNLIVDNYKEIVLDIYSKLDNIVEIFKESNIESQKNNMQIGNELNRIFKVFSTLEDKLEIDLEKIIKKFQDNQESNENIYDAFSSFDKIISKSYNEILIEFDQRIDLLNEKSNEKLELEFEKIEKIEKSKERLLEEKLKLIEKFLNEVKKGDAKPNENIDCFKNNLTKNGFIYLKEAETLYELVSNNLSLIDYSPIYINYCKFFESELKFHRDSNEQKESLGILLDKLERKKEWKLFVKEFKKRNLVSIRNNAAHPRKIKVSKADLDSVRLFLFEKNNSNNNWLEFLSNQYMKKIKN